MTDVMDASATVEVADVVEAAVEAVSAAMATTMTTAMATTMTAAMATTMTAASGRDGWGESCGDDRGSGGNSDDRFSKHGSVSSVPTRGDASANG